MMKKSLNLLLNLAMLVTAGMMTASCSNYDDPSENQALAKTLVGEWIYEHVTDGIEDNAFDEEEMTLGRGGTVAILYHFYDDGRCWVEVNLMKDDELVDQALSRYATEASTYTIDANGRVVIAIKNIDEEDGDDTDELTFDGTRLITNYANTDMSVTLVRATDAQTQLYKTESDAWHGGSDEAVENGVIDLSKLTSNYEAKDGDILTGTLPRNIELSMKENADITLRDVVVNNRNNNHAPGLKTHWRGTNTITLEGNNTIVGSNDPGIMVCGGTRLVIKGEGSLYVRGTLGSGIGCRGWWPTGWIDIQGGNITAIGSLGCAGIGTADSEPERFREVLVEGISDCRGITISGGTIEAIGGDFAAGIGGGYGGECEAILILPSVKKITATGGFEAHPIGVGRFQEGDYYSWCRGVTIGRTVIYYDGKDLWTPGSPLPGFDYEVYTTKDDDNRDITTWVLTPQ